MTATCKACGVPKLLSMTQTWQDGCIVDKTSGAASLCIYEASYPTALVKELEGRLGIPLDRIVYLAGTHAAVKVLGVLYESHPRIGKLLFSAPLHGFTENFLVSFGKAIGVANVNIIERTRKGDTKVTIRSPFDLSNCLAIISGILQVADGHPTSYNVLEENGDYLVEFTPAPEGESMEEAYQRLFAENLTLARSGASLELESCSKCSIPRAVGDLLAFETDQGFIVERGIKERMIFMGVHGLNSIIRELSRELGQTVIDLFVDFEKRHFEEKLARSPYNNTWWNKDFVRLYLAVRGFGLLDDLWEEGGTTYFSVDNAFMAPLVAGRLLALWEKQNERKGTYELEADSNALRLSVS